MWHTGQVSTYQLALLQAVAANGCAALGLWGTLAGDGRLIYVAARPGPDWHAHGSFAARAADLRRGRLRSVVVVKPRWRHRESGATCHSRPPDDLGLRYSGLVVALELWAWLDAGLGLHRYISIFPDLEERPSRRTVQRWIARFRPSALDLQQHLREALIDLCEPRPVEQIFPGGLSPPASLVRRAWRDPEWTGLLHRALAMLLGGAIALDAPVSSLLAEARRRLDTDCNRNE